MTDSILRSYYNVSSTTFVPFAITEPFVGLLDTYSGATGAFSFRKLRDAYAGSAVRIRRSSDNAEVDVGFTSGGDFDAAAAASHIGGGSGFITTIYDQSGNSRNLTQTTSTFQPLYVASGIGGFPSMQFDDGDDQLQTTNNWDAFINNNLAYAIVVVFLTSADGSIYCDGSDGYFEASFVSSNTLRMGNYDGGQDYCSFSITLSTEYIADVLHTGGNIIGSLNGSADVTTASGNTQVMTTTPVRIGNGQFSAMGGQISEVIFYDSDPGRPAIMPAINTYYGVY